MPIGTLNETQFSALNSIINLRAEQLVGNMVIVQVSGANSTRGNSEGVTPIDNGSVIDLKA